MRGHRCRRCFALRNSLWPQALFALSHWSVTSRPASAISVSVGEAHASIPTLHRWARGLGATALADRIAVLAVLAGILLAVGAVQALEARLTDLLLQQTAERAADQPRLALAPRLSADVFAPPYGPE